MALVFFFIELQIIMLVFVYMIFLAIISLYISKGFSFIVSSLFPMPHRRLPLHVLIFLRNVFVHPVYKTLI